MQISAEKRDALRAILAAAERLLPPDYAAYVIIYQTDSEKWISDPDIGAGTGGRDLQDLLKLSLALRDMRKAISREIRDWRAAMAEGEPPPPPSRPHLRMVT